jgi:hypothetical protein
MVYNYRGSVRLQPPYAFRKVAGSPAHHSARPPQYVPFSYVLPAALREQRGIKVTRLMQLRH